MNRMTEILKSRIHGKRICILGYGREGQSTYKLLRRIDPNSKLYIADINKEVKDFIQLHKGDSNLEFTIGPDYIDSLDQFDLIFKTPGITLKQLEGRHLENKIISQAEIFIEAYRDQIIGVTGTKGKSTTASLIAHVLKQEFNDVLIIGNIGLPPFEAIEEIEPGSKIVFEFSSHQLESINQSPSKVVILNVFEEHLDKYNSYQEYVNAKLNIAKYQNPGDILIYNQDNIDLHEALNFMNSKAEIYKISFVKRIIKGCTLRGNSIIYDDGHSKTEFDVIKQLQLKGKHNLSNVMAGLIACKLSGVSEENINSGLISYKGLKHRMEIVGKWGGIEFINDSIATIPQATIEAIKTFGNVEFLILGGYDRGLDYSYLVSYLRGINIKYILCIGKAGGRIYQKLIKIKSCSSIFLVKDYEEIFSIIRNNAIDGDRCLLSPAAASYDMFLNFEERGSCFINYAKKIRSDN